MLPCVKAYQLASVCHYCTSPFPSKSGSSLIRHLLNAGSFPASQQPSRIGFQVPILPMTKLRFREIKSNSSTVTKLDGGRTGIWLMHLSVRFLKPYSTSTRRRGGLWTTKSLCPVYIKVTWILSEAHRLGRFSRSSSSDFYPVQLNSFPASAWEALEVLWGCFFF